MIDETVKALRDRLTKPTENGGHSWTIIGKNSNLKTIKRRLGRYEDTGLTPDEIKQLQAENERLKASQPVRCGGCKFWKCVDGNVGDYERDGIEYLNTFDYDFCSYGERRDTK